MPSSAGNVSSEPATAMVFTMPARSHAPASRTAWRGCTYAVAGRGRHECRQSVLPRQGAGGSPEIWRTNSWRYHRRNSRCSGGLTRVISSPCSQ